MKNLLFVVALLSFSNYAIAEENYNYSWNGGNYFAKSTGTINAGIKPNGSGVTFHLLTDRCDRGNASAAYNDDCDRGIFRSQLQRESTLPIGKNLRYNFSINDDGKRGPGIKGAGINVFEIKPFGGGNPTVPTLSLYFQPKTRVLTAIVTLQNLHCSGTTCGKKKEFYKQIGVMTGGWNDFQIETKQSAGRDGYIRIRQNGVLIYEHYGKNSYKHPYGVQYWFGPYICCGNAQPGEPNRTLRYRGISGVIDNNQQATVVLPSTKPVVKVNPSMADDVGGMRFASFVFNASYNPANMFNYKDYVTFDFGIGQNKLLFGFTGDPEVENKIDRPFVMGYRFDDTILAIATERKFYGIKAIDTGFIKDAQTTYLILNHTNAITEKLKAEATFMYGMATAEGDTLVKTSSVDAYGLELGMQYLIDDTDNKYVKLGFHHPLRINKGLLEFNNFIADFTPEGREMKIAMSYGSNYNKSINYWTDVSYTQDKDNFSDSNDATIMFYINVKG